MGVYYKTLMQGGSIVIPTWNTYIGGVSATITSASALATKLGISVGNISDFTITGLDVKCNITGSYALPLNCWYTIPITYYTDKNDLVNAIGATAFYLDSLTIGVDAIFKNTITVGDSAFRGTSYTGFNLKSATTIGDYAFMQNDKALYYDIRSCTLLGTTVGYNQVFSTIYSFPTIYCHPSLATNNGGAEDGDIAYARSQGATIRFVINNTVPNAVTDLSVGTIYNTALQLNFTAPTGSTNTIEHYNCYADGVLKNKITASGEYIVGVMASTSYAITITAVDIFRNESVVSNSVTQSTNTTSAVPTTGLKSYYKVDETSGTVANDAYGTEHLTNTGISINQTGKVGKAYKATGAGQKLQTTTASPITGNFTMNYWMYATGAMTQYSASMEHGNYTLNAGFGFLLDGNNISWRINQNYNHFNQTFAYNQWNMITMTYDGSFVRMYINGVLKSKTAQTTNPNTTALKSIFFRQDQSQVALCSIDEPCTYNAALSQNQIDRHYNLGTGTTL
jgi:hypothetical protein